MKEQLQLISEREAAEQLGVSVRTLQNWRQRGKGPRYRKLGASKHARVRYEPSALETFAREKGSVQ